MNQEISGISSANRLKSNVRASMEKVETPKGIEGPGQVEKFESEMEQLSRAFALASEVRTSLESALQKLSG